MRTLKRSLAVFLAVLCLISALSVTGFAATKYKDYNGKYGLMIPVKDDFKTQCDTYKINSDKGTLSFSFKSKGHKKDVYFGLTIYEDEARQNILINKSGAFPTVNSTGSMSIDFSPLESGTYYGLTFTYIVKGSDVVVDKDSIYQFEIKLNKVGSVTPKITEAEALYSGNYIKWKKVTYADYYKVYRKQEGTSWEAIAQVTNLNYTDKTAKKGERYIYTVKAFDGECASKYSKNGVDLIYLAPVKINTTPETLEDNKIKVSWEAVKGAEKYRVYRKTAKETKYTRIATVGAGTLEYVDKATKKNGETYYYAVKAVNGTVTGALSQKAEKTLFGTQKPSVVCVGKAVKITWKSLENATDYKLFKKDAAGQWDLIYSGADALEYVDTDVASGKKYTYSLVVARNGEYSSFDTKGVTVYCLAEPKISSIASDADNSVLVKWKAVDGATRYNIYRESPFEEYKLVGTTTKTSFYDTVKKDSNYFYSYYVEAENDTSVSVSGNNTKMHLYMRAPELTSLKWSSSGNVLKWKRVAGATAYKILRRSPSGSYKVIAEVKNNVYSYKDKSVKKSGKYYYTVVAMNGKAQGAYDNGLGVNCLNEPTIKSVALDKKKQAVVKWEEVNGATGYYVYRKATIDGSWKKLGKTKSLSYTDKTSRTNGTEYYYCVSAYNSKGEGLRSKFGVKLK